MANNTFYALARNTSTGNGMCFVPWRDNWKLTTNELSEFRANHKTSLDFLAHESNFRNVNIAIDECVDSVQKTLSSFSGIDTNEFKQCLEKTIFCFRGMCMFAGRFSEYYDQYWRKKYTPDSPRITSPYFDKYFAYKLLHALRGISVHSPKNDIIAVTSSFCYPSPFMSIDIDAVLIAIDDRCGPELKKGLKEKSGYVVNGLEFLLRIRRIMHEIYNEILLVYRDEICTLAEFYHEYQDAVICQICEGRSEGLGDNIDGEQFGAFDVLFMALNKAVNYADAIKLSNFKGIVDV